MASELAPPPRLSGDIGSTSARTRDVSSGPEQPVSGSSATPAYGGLPEGVAARRPCQLHGHHRQFDQFRVAGRETILGDPDVVFQPGADRIGGSGQRPIPSPEPGTAQSPPPSRLLRAAAAGSRTEGYRAHVPPQATAFLTPRTNCTCGLLVDQAFVPQQPFRAAWMWERSKISISGLMPNSRI